MGSSFSTVSRHTSGSPSSVGSTAERIKVEVDYRASVERPADTARIVNAFLGGQLDEAGMAAAVNEELYRNRA